MRSFAGTRSFFGLVALAALLAAPAGSIVYVMQSDEDMLRHAQLIVWGEVTGTASARLDGRLVTDAQVRVETVLKGRLPGSAVTVRQPGGVEGGMREFLAGLPMLSEGNRVLLFLEKDEDVYRTVGLGLGIFFEASQRGRRILVRDAPHLASGQVAEEGSVRDSARFRRWLEDRAAGRESRADYLVAGPADGPRSVASPYVLFGRASNHFCLGERTFKPDGPESVGGRKKNYMAPRWRDFDLGRTITFRIYGVQRDALTDDDADEATEVADVMRGIRSAIGAWNRAAPGVSFAASHVGRDIPPSWGRDPNLAEIWLDVGHGADGVLAIASVSDLCDGYEDISLRRPHGALLPGPQEHTIPGTNVMASTTDQVTIKTYTLLTAYLELSSLRCPPDSFETLRCSTEGAFNDFVKVMTHEVGHALGLDHSDDSGAIMRPLFTMDGVNTGLGTDDVNGVRFLYPAVFVPPSFGGGAPAPEPEPEPEPEPPPPPPVPPVASFSVDMPCEDGLCSARTGEDATFTDTSSGTVARRSWDFEIGGRTPSGKSVTHTWSSPGFYRATLTVEGAGAESTSSRMFRVDAASPAGSCVPGPETACLQDSRFEIEVEWQGADGASNAARVVHAGTNDSGLFSFFDRDNWEMLVKVLDGCSINGHHWVYAASATTQPFEISITDTETGEVYRYSKGADELGALADPAAFADSCRPAG